MMKTFPCDPSAEAALQPSMRCFESLSAQEPFTITIITIIIIIIRSVIIIGIIIVIIFRGVFFSRPSDLFIAR